MRGLAGRLWLAAAAALLLDVAKGDYVQFVAGFHDGHLPKSRVEGRKSVFMVPLTPTPKTFMWKATNLKIQEINLFVQDTTAPNGAKLIGQWSPSPPKLDDTATNASEEANPIPERRHANQKRQQFGGANPTPGETRIAIPLTVISTAAGGSVTIPDLSKAIQGPKALYFEAVWPPTNGSGRSYSPAFAILSENDDIGLAQTANLPALFVDEPFSPEVTQRNNPNSDSDSGTPSGTTDTTPGPTLGSAPMPTANDSKSTGGLTTPAVAGIGAGIGVLGLLLIAFAIWYFLRKKKQQRQRDDSTLGGGGVSRSRTDELMAAEKEATLAAPAATAPYSDAATVAAAAAHHRSSMSGGGGAAAPLIAPVAAAEAVSPADGGPPGYTPYTDRPASGTGTTGTEPAVVSREYAHLVEEGMTEEEIRRLEEEERALDAAIEQAVRRPTG